MTPFNYTLSASGHKIRIRRHTVAGWTIVDETFWSGEDIAGIAEFCEMSENKARHCLNMLLEGEGVWVNNLPEPANEVELVHPEANVTHAVYLDHD